MGDADHLTHQFYLALGHTVIEPSAVAKDGIHEDCGAQRSLFLAVARHQSCLFVAEHQTCADGIERETEFFPYGQCPTDIVRRVLDVELPVVEGVRHECRG